MLDMYQVYSQQRPGRPRWALGSSAILLLLTVGLAAALVQHKTGGDWVPLESFSIEGLKGRLPAGWKPLETDLPAGTVTAVVEPSDSGKPPRKLFVFARLIPPVGSSERMAEIGARDYASELLGLTLATGGDMSEEVSRRGSGGRIAGQGAITVTYKVVPRQGAPVYCVVRVAMLSRLHAIGVAMLTMSELRETDRRLLDRIGTELQIQGLRPSGMPGESDEPGVPAHIES